MLVNILYQYVGEFNLGNDISNLTLTKWNGYDTFKFIYKDAVSEYDEVVLVDKTKTDVITSNKVNDIEFDYNKVIYTTYSCYKGKEKHCGKCGTCTERIEAFRDSGVTDPTEYEELVNV